MQTMQVAALGVDCDSGQAVLLLQETCEPRRVLPVSVGLPEAVAIERECRLERGTRPPTHALIGDVVRALDRRLDEVRITELRGGVFFAELVLDQHATVPARVSDAVALAVHLDVPIYAADTVLEAAAHPDMTLTGPDDTCSRRPVEQAATLEGFRRFLESASPQDFGAG